MGWSCDARVSTTLRRVTAACVESTGSMSLLKLPGGTMVGWEPSNREHEDGSCTGSCFVVVSHVGDHLTWKPGGSFRIEPTGRVSCAPSWFKKAAGGA